VAGWYLSQEFAPDTPGSQVFLAPGPDERRLTDAPSPWIMGRLVQFPARYWHRLLIAIADDNVAAAELLDRWSGSADPDDLGEQLPTPEEMTCVRRAAEGVAARLRARNVVSDEELEELGPYTREDMARMLDAVMLVFDEAVTRGLPFSAWPE
jgi:hypothetical protein